MDSRGDTPSRDGDPWWEAVVYAAAGAPPPATSAPAQPPVGKDDL